MTSFYHTTNDIAVLRERIAELSRIRSGFCAHLGSSLYKAIDRDSDLYWGRETLFEGIATCDAERQRILERIEALTKEDAAPFQNVEVAQEEELPLEVTKEMPRVVDIANEPEAVEESGSVDTPEADTPIVAETIEDADAVMEPAADIVPEEEEAPAPTEVMDAIAEPASPVFDMTDEGKVAEAEALEALQPNVQPNGNATVVVTSPVADDAATVIDPHQFSADVSDLGNAISSMPIVDASAPKTCTKCGFPVGEGDKFCMNCGSPVASASQSTCPNCGSIISSDYMFCMICGQRLK